jgi:hypothetical protein
MFSHKKTEELFASIDAMNTEAFLSFLDPGCCFRFGNRPTVVGVEPTRAFVGGFFSSIAALEHSVAASWDTTEGVVAHGLVTYTRHDDSTLTVPFAVILNTAGEGITEYLVFADTSDLYR